MIIRGHSIDDVWYELVPTMNNTAAEHESRAGKTRELLGVQVRLEDPRCCFLYNTTRNLPVWYPAAELIWLLGPDPRTEMIKAYAPRYENFENLVPYLGYEEPQRVALGHYGARWWEQLPQIVELLRRKPETRQAVIALWAVKDVERAEGSVRDLPCTLAMQFLIRDGKLHLIVNMRSNDAWLGLPNDVFTFCHLQMIIANELKLALGEYIHNVGSMHVYERNYEKFFESADYGCETENMDYVETAPYMMEHIKHLQEAEEHNRKFRVCAEHAEDRLGGSNSLYAQVLFMATSKWDMSALKKLRNKTLKKVGER